MGVNVSLYKALAFGISAGTTGVAGASWRDRGAVRGAGWLHGASSSIALFLGMVVGGVGWLPGALVGSAFICIRAEHRRGGLQGPVRRGVRRDPDRGDLLGATWLAPGGLQDPGQFEK
ncbi:MAG: hypothetical protein MZV49_16955 [Rhodopseudomonas palustris]|nr:hypothetical protein [Rhodopseudomonas palustris]